MGRDEERNQPDRGDLLLVRLPPLARPSSPLKMVAPQVIRSVINLGPSARTLATGVPVARGINLAASAGQSHGHGHGAVGPRQDVDQIPKWVARVEVGPLGLTQRSKQNGRLRAAFPPTRSEAKEVPPHALRAGMRGQGDG